jgi:hypothetical protein
VSADFQVMPALAEPIEAALRASIQRFGVLVPVTVDQHGTMLDGHHRRRIADELKVPYNRLVRVCDSDDERREIATTLNADRRHLTEGQRRAVVAALSAQGHSVRAIAGAVGVGKSTVQDDITQLSGAGQLDRPEKTVGLDGKARPARRLPQAFVSTDHYQRRAGQALSQLAEHAPHSRTGKTLTARDIRNLESEAQRAANGTITEKHFAERLTAAREREPDLDLYAEAVGAGELDLLFWNDSPYLRVKDFATPFTGQTWRWPRYTGISTTRMGDSDDTTVPLFTVDEWDEITNFGCNDALRDLVFPGHALFSWTVAPWERDRYPLDCPTVSRDYDPTYGAFIIEHPEPADCTLEHHAARPLFVRRGWGEWCLVEFNDGAGQREQRRIFRHDDALPSAVEQAYDTVDPLTFSSANLRELLAAAYKAMPVQMSWFYVRHRSIDRDAAVTALEDAIQQLRDREPLEADEISEHAAIWLQNFTPADPDHWREGECTFPRHDDGTIDTDEYARCFLDTRAAS